MSLFSITLFIHVFLSIAVFGPTFTFRVWTSRAQKEPRYTPFVLSTLEFLGGRWIIPGSVLLFLSGVVLIILGSWNLFTAYWLDLAIILFGINFALSLWVTRPNVLQMLGLVEKMAQNPQDATVRQQLQALGKKQGKVGIFSAISLIIIIFLMVVKPF